MSEIRPATTERRRQKPGQDDPVDGRGGTPDDYGDRHCRRCRDRHRRHDRADLVEHPELDRRLVHAPREEQRQDENLEEKQRRARSRGRCRRQLREQGGEAESNGIDRERNELPRRPTAPMTCEAPHVARRMKTNARSSAQTRGWSRTPPQAEVPCGGRRSCMRERAVIPTAAAEVAVAGYDAPHLSFLPSHRPWAALPQNSERNGPIHATPLAERTGLVAGPVGGSESCATAATARSSSVSHLKS